MNALIVNVERLKCMTEVPHFEGQIRLIVTTIPNKYVTHGLHMTNQVDLIQLTNTFRHEVSNNQIQTIHENE